MILAEVFGYYWPVPVGAFTYSLSFDIRPIPAGVFGILAGVVASLLSLGIYSRKRPILSIQTLAAICILVAVWLAGFLVLFHAEFEIWPLWIPADALVFLVSFLVVFSWASTRPMMRSRAKLLACLVLATVLSSSLTIPAYLSGQKSTLLAATMTCETDRCPIGIADETSSGPPWGRLVQGRIYDFYFDVIQGRIEVKLVSQPGLGNSTYWLAGGTQNLSHWNGIGIGEFQWTPNATGFYQMIFMNGNSTTKSTIVIRVTVA